MHENEGNSRNQPSGEENMDLWNNEQGREIGKEVKKSKINKEELEDALAEKVMERMRAGKLITNPSDTRRYVPKNANGTPTGHAAPISK